MSQKIERLIRLYNRLRRGPVTVDTLHKWAIQAEISVSPRQLYRDLLTLCSLQLADDEKVIMEELGEKNQKIFKLIYTKEQDIKLSDYDLNTFAMLRNFAPYSILQVRKESVEKIDTLLYKQLSKNKTERTFKTNEHARNSHFYEYLHYGAVQNKIEDIIWAINHNKQLVVGNLPFDNLLLRKHNAAFARTPNEIPPVIINPIYLLHHRGDIFCCCIHSATNTLCILGVHQYITLEVTSNNFKRKDGEALVAQAMQHRFGIHEIIDDKVFDIVLQLNKHTCQYLQHFYWHSTQSFKEEGDYMIMTMRCGINMELLGWIAMWLNHIKVLQPLELKQKMQEQLQQMQNLYSQNEQPYYDIEFLTSL